MGGSGESRQQGSVSDKNKALEMRTLRAGFDRLGARPFFNIQAQNEEPAFPEGSSFSRLFEQDEQHVVGKGRVPGHLEMFGEKEQNMVPRNRRYKGG